MDYDAEFEEWYAEKIELLDGCDKLSLALAFYGGASTAMRRLDAALDGRDC